MLEYKKPPRGGGGACGRPIPLVWAFSLPLVLTEFTNCRRTQLICVHNDLLVPPLTTHLHATNSLIHQITSLQVKQIGHPPLLTYAQNVHYNTINCGKSNQKCTVIAYLSLKFIYLFIAPTCFGYSLAVIRVLVIWYGGKTMCIYFKIQLFTLVFFSFNVSCVNIINKY